MHANRVIYKQKRLIPSSYFLLYNKRVVLGSFNKIKHLIFFKLYLLYKYLLHGIKLGKKTYSLLFIYLTNFYA